MTKKEEMKLFNIISEISDAIDEIFKKNGIHTIGEVDFIMHRIFFIYYSSSLDSMPIKERNDYVAKRTVLIAQGLSLATSHIMSREDSLKNNKGECACDNCKNKKDKEIYGQTIH